VVGEALAAVVSELLTMDTTLSCSTWTSPRSAWTSSPRRAMAAVGTVASTTSG
jgi:hypothetical protein